jgi:hypothetical protein
VTLSAVRPGYPPASIPPYRSLRCIGSPLQIAAGDRRPSTWIPLSSNTLIPPAVDISISPVQYIGAPSQIPAHGRPSGRDVEQYDYILSSSTAIKADNYIHVIVDYHRSGLPSSSPSGLGGA